MAGGASSNIVAKCLGARPGTAAKGVECLLLFIEAECGEKVVVGGSTTGGRACMPPNHCGSGAALPAVGGCVRHTRGMQHRF